MALNSSVLSTFITEHQLDNANFVVALSGGVDSMCLLALFAELNRQQPISFSAIHINHGISNNADTWQQHIQNHCQQLNIELQTVELSVKTSGGQSLEAIARESRYQAIAECLAENSVLVTGHHQDDQFETFFLRLMRKSGLTGLGAMKALSRFPNQLGRDKNIQLARPLLNCQQQQIEQYAHQQHISWVEDESNINTDFDRNFVRHKVLPVVKERWPGATQAVSESAILLQQQQQLLDEYLELDLTIVVEQGFLEQPVVNMAKLVKLSNIKQQALLRRFCQINNIKTPNTGVMSQIVELVNDFRMDGAAVFNLGECELRQHGNKLYIVKPQVVFSEDISLALANNTNQMLPIGSLFTAIKVSSLSLADFSLSYGNFSAKLQLNENSGSKPVKQLLKQLACPPWLRSSVPLVFHQQQLIAVGNWYIDWRYKEKVQLSWTL